MHAYDDSQVTPAFHVNCSTYAEVPAEGCSRRQFRDGRLQLLRRLDKAYTNIPTQDIVVCSPSCACTTSLADPHLESDRSLLKLVFARPRARGPFHVPRWAPEHLADRAFVDEHLVFYPGFRTTPWENYTKTPWLCSMLPTDSCADRHACMHAATRLSWLGHWLVQGFSAWHRSLLCRCSGGTSFTRPSRRLHGLGLLEIFPEERFAELTGGIMHTILMAELSDDVHRARTDEKAPGLRARFHCRLASWSPKRRVIHTMLVTDEDGAPYPTADAQAAALSRHWGRQFSETRPIDRATDEEQLRQCSALRPDALQPPDFSTSVSALFDHLTHSALGPDGLPCSCWSAARDRVRHVLFDVYTPIANCTDVPVEFNALYIVHIPTATTLPGELAYQALLSRYRPLNLSNSALKIVPKPLSSALQDAASAPVFLVQREL